jgi:uncharacterized protein YdeI (YjbR/CyaY-like superfamily)
MAAFQTKKGEPVPEELAGAIQNDPQLKALWDIARPSCQTRYAAHIVDAKSLETRSRRVSSVLTMMAKTYGPKLRETA